MNTYIYQAALYCEECGRSIRTGLRLAGRDPDDWQNESSYDSDAFPKGPYSDGGGEADSPNHCDQCHVFLENPLTSDGERYVKTTVAEWERERTPDAITNRREYRGHYGYLWHGEENP